MNLAGLLWMLRRKVGPLGMRAIFTAAGRMCLLAVVMGLVVAAVAYLIDWGPVGSWPRRYLRPLAAVLGGVLVYLGLARAWSMPELGQVMDMMRRRR